MIRSLTVFSLAATLITILAMPIMVLQPGPLLLGGQYHIGPGETMEEDVSFYFAQVTIDEGALVDGNVSLYSSTLDLRGHVTEGIHAFESDLTLHDAARVDGAVDETDFIHWTLLLPGIVQFP